MRKITTILLLCLSATLMQAQITIGGNIYGGGNAGDTKGNTNVTVYAGDLNRVFGGAQKADVGGHSFVHIDGEHASNYVLINHVYGGNDVSGVIGNNSGLEKSVPEEIKKATENLVDKSWNAFVRISTKMNGDVVAEDNQKIYIGQLFGGGNGAYDYTSEKLIDGVTPNPYYGLTKPELAKSYLEVMGGSIVYAFGGGNNATVTEKTVIYVDNPSKVVNQILVDRVDQITKDNRVVDKMGLNPGYTYPSSDAFQIGSFFGGNNTAEMKIRPRWNLKSGKIRNVYSGGNKGDMTSPDGLLLQIPEESSIIVDNVYGGCRMADIIPKDKDGNPVTAAAITEDDYGHELHIPAGMAARARVLGGHVNNVYGGNDITGRISGGSTVGIYTTIYGDVYGGGNGSYPYTDNAKLKDDPTYGDLYYTIPAGKSSVEALNDYRPNAEQVSIYVQGTEAKKTIIHGSVYCGGNSASLSSSMDNPKVELKVGSYAIVDNLFLGNNGEHMVETHEKDATHPQEGVLRTMKSTSITSDGSQFNSIDLTNSETFATYMEGVTMPLIPSIVFAKESSGDPATYIPYTSYFGSVYCGGNVGSMKIDGKKTALNFTENVIIYNKLVGGCNNANVASTAFNAAYDGGFIGSPDTNGDKLQLNLSGLRIQPKRWKKNIGDYYTPELAEGESYDTYPGYTDYVIDANGNHLLEWNTISSNTGKEVRPVLSGTGISSDEDKARRFIGGNVYGGCYNSGHINGNVIINMNSTVVDRKGQYAVFDQVLEDEGEAKLYENDNYHITTRVSGVILDEQGMDVLGSALNVFGGGYGKDSEIWGNVTVNLNAGYTFQIFGGGEQGVIGKPNDGTGDDYTFNSKTFKYNPKYSCTINVKGNYPGVARNAPGDNDNMAAAEFIYGGGFKGPVCGNTVINLGNGRVFNTFAGACDADILGHTATYMGRNTNDDTDRGFPYVRDHVYGGNDLGGRIMGSADFSGRLSADLPITPYKPEETSAVTTASAYMEYVQGHVDYIFGGCYGDYDYATEYAGYTSPRMENAFVNFKPNQHISNGVNKIFGAGQGAAGFNTTDKNLMQNRSYVLMDLANTGTKFADLEVFGAGQNCGVGMGVAKATADGNADGVTAAAVVDLARGQIGAAYGGSLNEGVTRRTIVNVPTGSTIKIGSIFAGAYGSDIYQPCDVYEGTVNYHSADAYLIYNKNNTMMKGALYGGNNLKRRTIYGKINIDVPVRQSHPDLGMTTATVYGAGCGSNTWSEYTEVNLNNGAQVWEVYGGGEAGGVMSAESVQKYVTAFKPAKDEQGNDMTDAKWQAAWTLGGDYDPDMASFPGTFAYAANTSTNLQNPIARVAEIDDRKDTPNTLRFKRYNTNVIINEGAYVGNYAYGGGLGKADDVFISSGDVYGTTYIALLGGKVNKDLYAAGTMGTVYNLFGADFIASANAYIQGGTARNVYGGGWAGAVGYHTGDISAATTTDIPGETHVVIGKKDGTSFVDGLPAIERNAYGGGEGGPVFGTTNITLNKGYIGYRYFVDQASADPGAELIGITDGGGYYQEKLHDETWSGDGSYRLKDSGNIFGGGYVDNSSVDESNVTMYGGHVRNSLFGGGEIAAVGRGVIVASGEKNSIRNLQGIYKAGHTSVKLYEGFVHRNVFGGGRGYNNLGEGGKLYSDGYVFGQTEVDIHGGEVGTNAELANGNGNVFGGGDIGYVYSAYEDSEGALCFGKKSGVRYDDGDEGYYYKYENGTWKMDGTEKILTEDCKVLIEPHARVTSGTINYGGKVYNVGDYVPIAYLNTLGNKNSGQWGNLDTEGITIHNAVFAGGNTSSGSDKVFANATSIFGNATASIHDVYSRDLITLGTNHVGGLYGDGNLTFVDGYRGLNITNYGTDYYSISKEITIDEYNALPAREAAYYELRYTCVKECTDDDGTAYHPKDPSNPNSKASTLSALEIISLFKNNTQGVLDHEGQPSSTYWQENGVLPVYAGRPMNTIQRADFCGVFGSRMVMQGAQDRVPEIADYTNYTINRVREVSLNKKLFDKSIPTGDYHGNYFGIYNIVNYFGALTSDVDFHETVRVTDNTDAAKYKSPAVTPSGTYPYEVATYEQWKEAHKADRTRNNGNSHNKVALASGVYLELTTEQSTGTDVYEKDWGYITGVVELDLINVQTGIGGGFVYAKNEHGKRGPSGKTHTTITDLNTGAVTQKDFIYTTNDESKDEWESSGNFVHSTQVIIDDCYNVSGKYKGTVAPGGAVPAHYWYIQGSVYVYDQYISAYTGAPNAYSETVEIPLTITAASHGTMKLLNVQPNYYAYYASSGHPLADGQKLIINDVTYYKNDPISYWDYFLLSQSEKSLFVPATYVTIGDCKVNGTPYAEGTVLLSEQYNTLRNSSPSVTYEEGGVEKTDKDFDYFFRSSNNVSHDTGYMLTYKVNNPSPWDLWYTKFDSAKPIEDRQQTAADGYNNGPTYRLKDGLTGGLLGQQEYKESDVISKIVYDTYQGVVTSHPEVIPAEGQAFFEDAYVITSAVDVTVGTSTRHLNPGAVISATEKTSYGLSEANSSPAYICTRTIQLSATDYIYQGTKMSSTEKGDYITSVTADIKAILPAAENVTKISDLTEEQLKDLTADQKRNLAQLLTVREEIKSDVIPAYYCKTAGLYGGDYYESGKNYRGLAIWSSMSKDDREKFAFNYDALDLLIDRTYSGTVGKKYQYDSEAATLQGAQNNPAGYSLDKPVDYTATYNGSDPELETGKEYTREQFEALANEKRHYSGIVVNDKDATYYVVNTSFQIGNTPYAVGSTISSSVYETLGDTDKGYITKLQFSEIGTYYYCRENYTIGEKGSGVAVNCAVGVTVNGQQQSGSYSINDNVPLGVVIDATNYVSLVNKQVDFTIHGIAPTEVSTLYVSRNSDIFDLSKEKIITVIYQYDYEEADALGNITPQSERHVVNIHLTFKSGIPFVENIKVPQLILPGDNVALREPVVTPGAYEITGGGWEIFQDEKDAESHVNGIEYSPNFDPLYWYQNGYFVAYYAKTYLGKTYSNHVPLSVANYHDLKKVLDDTSHHYYVDNPAVKRNSKIYINDAVNGATQLKQFYDLSKSTLDEHVRNCQNLEFILHTNVNHTGEWTPIGDEGHCFEGNFHGDGYHIDGLDHSLFGQLCGNVYNLGVTGSFTGAGIADTGSGYVENCWISTSSTDAKTSKPVFGNPNRGSGYQLVNCYYQEEADATNKYTNHSGTYGIPTRKNSQAFYNGEVAYDLNGFYLFKRYNDHETASGIDYKYYAINEDGTLTEPKTKHYGSSPDYCSSGVDDVYLKGGYVEDRYGDGDYRYADGVIPETEDVRTFVDANGISHFYPIWPDDYLYFGQALTYGYDASRAHQDIPSHINQSGNRLQTDATSNRVYRAPAYFQSKEMSMAHFNPKATFAQTKNGNANVVAYKNMTAIDFTGGNGDVSGGYKKGLDGKVFYAPLLDDDGLTGFRNVDLTQNLLVYTGTVSPASAATDAVVSGYLPDVAYSETDATYRTVAIASTNGVKGHQIVLDGSAYKATKDHLLVDKQDFNCPISYKFASGKRMWYQRTPDLFVDLNKGWETVSLPFTAELVTTQQKGEITHFYSGSRTIDGNGTKIGHEYWLREYIGKKAGTAVTNGIFTAAFNYPDAAGSDKQVDNTFLWDYYYSLNGRLDANTDTYQTYYQTGRNLASYPLLATAKPYIIGFPGKTYYEFDLSGEWTAKNTATPAPEQLSKQAISFVSEPGITIAVSDNELNAVSEDNYSFVPNYMSKKVDGYLMNATGSSFDKTPDGGLATVPFRPYFVAAPAQNGAPRRAAAESIVFDRTDSSFAIGDDPSDELAGELTFSTKPRKLITTSSLRQPADVRIYNVSGVAISTFTIQPGETIETDITVSGVYIIRAANGRYMKKLALK
ncbi:T9SS type A sorting domain-containing protein [Prevotella lacticifex]|nr:T9SS type A sorting domain-containing protein [Prevotella lacticifex]